MPSFGKSAVRLYIGLFYSHLVSLLVTLAVIVSMSIKSNKKLF